MQPLGSSTPFAPFQTAFPVAPEITLEESRSHQPYIDPADRNANQFHPVGRVILLPDVPFVRISGAGILGAFYLLALPPQQIALVHFENPVRVP